MKDQGVTHPGPDRLAAYASGRMSPAEMDEIEHHLSSCEACCRAVRDQPGDTLMELLRARRAAATQPPTPVGPGPETMELPIPSSFITMPTASPGAVARAAPDPVPADVVGLPADLLNHPRYRVVAPLGSGGMGAVYRAEHRLMERQVALKVIRHDLTDRVELVERFRREVRAAARLSHPNIVHAYDAEQAGATHFLVMEFVEGTDLGRVVRQRGPLPVAEACDAIRQAALGLQHAHERGMVHRDIKPQNLMRTPGGQVKILDFGLARFASEVGASGAATEPGMVLGTADYMAPEQADDSRTADIRADIYSLGCSLYFLLAGHPPFPGGSIMTKLRAHSQQTPRPMAALRGDLPPGLARVLDRMMAKDPAHRYQTPAEVARALAPFADAAATGPAVAPPTVDGAVDATAPTQPATPAPLPAAKKPAAADLAESALGGASPAHRRRWPRTPIAVSVAVLLFGLGLLGVIYRISTDKGELIIETDDPNIEVVIKQGGRLVTIIDPETDQTIELRSGDYQVALNGKPKGLQLSTSTFTLKRGEREVVRVRRVPASAPARRPWPARPPAAEPVGEVRRFEGHTEAIHRIALSPDGRLAVSTSGGHYHRGGGWDNGSDFALRLWDVATGQEIRRFEGHTNSVADAAFSPDGRFVLSAGCDLTLRLWDVRTGKELRRFLGHTDWPRSVAFSPDGRTAISGARDRTVRLWDVETGKELRQFNGLSGELERSPSRPMAASPSSPEGSGIRVTSSNRIRCICGTW